MQQAAEQLEQKQAPLLRTPLYARHIAAGARMVGFAGYAMPVQYKQGVLAEHHHTRNAAGLFDVSHMGQIELAPSQPDQCAAEIFERAVAGGITSLKHGQMRYTQFTNSDGGILDDLMVTRFDNKLWLVVNAACKQADTAHLRAIFGDALTITTRKRALIALQGPQAAEVLSRLVPQARALNFMHAQWLEWNGENILVSRCGYTGEDGFEISLANNIAESFAASLLGEPETAPIGLGARDSLRLEAGLCLYGHDITTSTSPFEAALQWSVPARRLREGNFAGASVLQAQAEYGTARRRVGLMLAERAIAREGTPITHKGYEVGAITSGGFSPSLEKSIAMGYVQAAYTQEGTELTLLIRNKPHLARVVALPFVPHKYHKGEK